MTTHFKYLKIDGHSYKLLQRKQVQISGFSY